MTAGSFLLSFPIKMHRRKSWLLREGGIEFKSFNLIQRGYGLAQPWHHTHRGSMRCTSDGAKYSTWSQSRQPSEPLRFCKRLLTDFSQQ